MEAGVALRERVEVEWWPQAERLCLEDLLLPCMGEGRGAVEGAELRGLLLVWVGGWVRGWCTYRGKTTWRGQLLSSNEFPVGICSSVT